MAKKKNNILLTNFHPQSGGSHDTYIRSLCRLDSDAVSITVAAPATSSLFRALVAKGTPIIAEYILATLPHSHGANGVDLNCFLVSPGIPEETACTMKKNLGMPKSELLRLSENALKHAKYHLDLRAQLDKHLELYNYMVRQ